MKPMRKPKRKRRVYDVRVTQSRVVRVEADDLPEAVAVARGKTDREHWTHDNAEPMGLWAWGFRETAPCDKASRRCS